MREQQAVHSCSPTVKPPSCNAGGRLEAAQAGDWASGWPAGWEPAGAPLSAPASPACLPQVCAKLAAEVEWASTSFSRSMQLSKPPEERSEPSWMSGERSLYDWAIRQEEDGTFTLTTKSKPDVPAEVREQYERGARRTQEKRQQEWRRIEEEGAQRRLQARREQRAQASGRR